MAKTRKTKVEPNENRHTHKKMRIKNEVIKIKEEEIEIENEEFDSKNNEITIKKEKDPQITIVKEEEVEIESEKINGKEEINLKDEKYELVELQINLRDVELEFPEVKEENPKFILFKNIEIKKTLKPKIQISPLKNQKGTPKSNNIQKNRAKKVDKLQCKKCDKKFKDKSSLVNHNCAYCKICNKKFTKYESLHLHNKNMHNSNRIKLKCDFCGKSFVKKQHLILHFKGVHVIVESHERVQCDICGKYFANLTLLRSHMANHTKIKCQICYREISKNAMRNHLRIFHAKKGSFKCKNCPETFDSKYFLMSHITAKHEKKYECKFCKKNFLFPKMLKDHLKVHENPETFQCEICKKNFLSHFSRQTHIKFMHGERNEKVFKCDKCDYACKREQALKRHQEVHRNYEKKLKSRSDWIKCEKCPALLATKDTFKLHLKYSHGNSHFECDLCGKLSKKRTNFVRHFKGVHKNKEKL